eukprot:728720-Prorocentrum_minimum.AAC.1
MPAPAPGLSPDRSTMVAETSRARSTRSVKLGREPPALRRRSLHRSGLASDPARLASRVDALGNVRTQHHHLLATSPSRKRCATRRALRHVSHMRACRNPAVTCRRGHRRSQGGRGRDGDVFASHLGEPPPLLEGRGAEVGGTGSVARAKGGL